MLPEDRMIFFAASITCMISVMSVGFASLIILTQRDCPAELLSAILINTLKYVHKYKEKCREIAKFASKFRIVYEVIMIQQVEITLRSKSRGFHLVTSEIMSQLPKLPKTGIINIFCKHTSCGLSINENADPDVRVDMETIFNRLVPENRPEYEHTLEGADDMPAHAKSTLSGVSLTIPITNGRLNMGTWQGIYFCEYRNYGGARKLVVTIIGE